MVPVDADLVVATNFPSYFVRHPRKVVWLFHQHRGAYELADEAWSDIGTDDASLEVQRLLADGIPGHWARRRLYPLRGPLPTGCHASTDWPPSRCTIRRRCRPADPRTVRRLHFLRYSAGAQQASPAGCRRGPGFVLRGPRRHRGSWRSAGRPRSSARQPELRNRSSCSASSRRRAGRSLRGRSGVVYAPRDEDYGYATLQAFLAGKPVITAPDSGGVLEFVEDGVTGFVTDGSPESLGKATDRLAEDPGLAQRMGEEGRARIQGWSWSEVVATLLEQ